MICFTTNPITGRRELRMIVFRTRLMRLKYIKKLKSGEIYPEIIDDNYSFLIIKLIRMNKNRYFIERISIDKPDFDAWFKCQAVKIPIKISDGVIKRELLSQYGNVWWVKNLN